MLVRNKKKFHLTFYLFFIFCKAQKLEMYIQLLKITNGLTTKKNLTYSIEELKENFL